MAMQRTVLLTEGPVGKILFRMTLPMVFGTLSMVLFNLADAYFVGQLGTDELAALSFTFPFMMVISNLTMGLGVGLTAVVSHAIGRGNHHEVQRLTTDGLLLSLVIVAIMIVIGLVTMEPILGLLGARGNVADMASIYLRIWYLAMVFVVVPVVGNNAIRAAGNTLIPSIIMIFAVVINVVLDPLLIFGWGPFPRLEVAGAALATVISRAITLFLSIGILWLRQRMITFKPPTLAELADSWKRMLAIALPTGAARVMLPLSIGVVTGIVATWGDPAVAAFGVSLRIEFLALAVAMSLANVIGPYVGQNLGAGRHDRVMRGINLSAGFSMVWSFALYVLLFVFARPIAGLFDDNPAVIDNIVLYLQIVPLGHGLLGVLMISGQALNVVGRPLLAATLQFTQVFVLYIPLAWGISRLIGLPGVFVGMFIANVLSGASAYQCFRMVVGKEKKAVSSVSQG